jgi:hypothetical protein
MASSVTGRIRPAPERLRQLRRIAAQVLLTGGQVFFAGLLAIGWDIVADALGWTEQRQFPLAPAGPQVFNACMVAVLGLVLGWLLVWLLPEAASAGLWVWLPPTALLALLIGLSVLDHVGWHLISATYFWSYPGRKIGPIGREMFTYPTLSAITYSLGVLVRISQCRNARER